MISDFLRVAKYLTASIALLMAALMGGCDEEYTFIRWLDPNVGVEDRLLVLEPALLDLGNIPPLAVSSSFVVAKNVGRQVLYIDDVFIDDSLAFVAESPTQTRLEPGEETRIPISYRPTQFEKMTATLVVTSNDPVVPRLISGLSGRSEAPQIHLNPPAFDFGLEFVGCPLSHEMTMENRGPGVLKVESLGLSGENGEFRVSLDPPIALPLTLAPGESHGLLIDYRPGDAGEDLVAVQIASNDPIFPIAEAAIYGAGQLEGQVVDRFDQIGNNKTDILFVVDNSFSMAEEQDTLACNFASFLNVVDTLNIDYHIGVITTDNPVLQGEEKVITPESTHPLERFTENVQVGIDGFTQEQGFEMALQALTYPLVDSQNEGFFRPTAGLRIIFVSDEDDQSQGGVEDYMDSLASLNQIAQALVVSAIVGDLGNGCGGDSGKAVVSSMPQMSLAEGDCESQQCGRAISGTRYLQAVEETAGIFGSICSCNFITALEEIAFETVHLVDTFFLSQVPRTESLKVFVNGELSETWTYLPTENAIFFEEALEVPPNGARVQVEYDLQAYCDD